MLPASTPLSMTDFAAHSAHRRQWSRRSATSCPPKRKRRRPDADASSSASQPNIALFFGRKQADETIALRRDLKRARTLKKTSTKPTHAPTTCINTILAPAPFTEPLPPLSLPPSATFTAVLLAHYPSSDDSSDSDYDAGNLSDSDGSIVEDTADSPTIPDSHTFPPSSPPPAPPTPDDSDDDVPLRCHRRQKRAHRQPAAPAAPCNPPALNPHPNTAAVAACPIIPTPQSPHTQPQGNKRDADAADHLSAARKRPSRARPSRQPLLPTGQAVAVHSPPPPPLIAHATATAATLPLPGESAPATAIATAVLLSTPVVTQHQPPPPSHHPAHVAGNPLPDRPTHVADTSATLLPSMSAYTQGRKRKAAPTTIVDLTSSPPPATKAARKTRDTHASRGRGALASRDQQLAILTAGLPRTPRVFSRPRPPPPPTCQCFGICCCPKVMDV
jgi:hypothetical protein